MSLSFKTVKELKHELRSRGLKQTGNKASLRARLYKAIKQENESEDGFSPPLKKRKLDRNNRDAVKVKQEKKEYDSELLCEEFKNYLMERNISTHVIESLEERGLNSMYVFLYMAIF